MRAPAAVRFWAKVNKEASGGCWLWTGSVSNKGYGQFRLGDKGVKAHRFAYETLVGPVPEGLQLDHLCRVRHCVNPAHLEPVTGRENCLRGVSPAAQHATKTHCPQGHPYEGENVYLAPTGRRYCRVCQRAAYNRRRRAANKPEFGMAWLSVG